MPASPACGRQASGAPPPARFIEGRNPQKNVLILLEEKIRRAQNEKSKEYFSVVWRACRAAAGVPARRSFSVGGASLVGGLLKESSNISQKTPPVG